MRASFNPYGLPPLNYTTIYDSGTTITDTYPATNGTQCPNGHWGVHLELGDNYCGTCGVRVREP